MLDRSVGQVLIIQLICTVIMLIITAILGLSHRSEEIDQVHGHLQGIMVDLGSSLYGSTLAITGTILSARSVTRASRVAHESGNAAIVPIYSGLLNKLVIVGGGIAFGLIVLDLKPLFVVTSYIVVQLSTAWTLIKSGK